MRGVSNKHCLLTFFIVTEVLGQRGSETPVHSTVTIRELRHANVDKQSKLLADVNVAPPRGAVQIT